MDKLRVLTFLDQLERYVTELNEHLPITFKEYVASIEKKDLWKGHFSWP